MDTILNFSKVSYDYSHNKVILDESSFVVRKGMKVALMGQNGAGKTTLFKLLTGELAPSAGRISIEHNFKIAIAKQMLTATDLELSILEFFQNILGHVEMHELQRKLNTVLDAVSLHAPLEKKLKSFSGGQQARILLASALIQNPDLLLLDEPTNNLDHAGIEHLTNYLIYCPSSVIVISHDAEFLNSFTEGVLYLDSFTKKIEQYAGNYNDVLEQIAARIERDALQNSRMERGIQENKDKANFFANKGGRLRQVAKKMREKAAEMEENKVDVRREDKTIRPFQIPSQNDLVNEYLKITKVTIIKNHEEVQKQVKVFLVKGKHLHIIGPNGIGKSTLIKSLIDQTAQNIEMTKGVRIGSYAQDFSTLDPSDTVYESLIKATVESGEIANEQNIRSVASGFLITSEYINATIESLSEGQKGLVSFARLVLQKPGLLILDEPTNHINFRHIPLIAKALNDFAGMMILVSHVPNFVDQIRIDEVLDLSK